MVNATQSSTYSLSATSLTIVRALLYFDVFLFPLLLEEIQQYTDSEEGIENELDGLVSAGIIFKIGSYYGLEDLQEKINRREAGKIEAELSWKNAKLVSRLLAIIPFVRCICISGSLSKNYMDQNSDIDYFIIVKSNRLWIVRAIFSFFILGFSAFKIKKYFCPNYIIVDSNLEIRDKNIFTATEICTLVPLYNEALFQNFRSKNQWVKDFLPNPKVIKIKVAPERKHSFNFFWNSFFCEALDDFFFSIYRWHYGRKFRNLSDRNLTQKDINVRKNNYKMHSSGHRGRILSLYDEKLEQFSRKFQIGFTQISNG